MGTGDDDLDKLLKDLKDSTPEYRENLKDGTRLEYKFRVNEMIRRDKRSGCACIILLLFIIFLVLIYLFSQNQIGFYDGLNKGIYFLNCGFEFVGNFGAFCD